MALEDLLKYRPGAGDNEFAQLLQALIGSNTNREKDRQKQVYQTILGIDSSVKNATGTGQLQGIIDILNQNSSLYSQNKLNEITKTEVKNQAGSKIKKIEHFKEKVDGMQDAYIGQPTNNIKGFGELDESDFKYWTYDYISSELMKIKDFESAFYEDYAQTQEVNYDYNPNKISTKDLRNRVGAYKNKLLTGLEATKHDNLIQDHELVYILTGSSAELAQARLDNMKNYNNLIKSNLSSFNAIKNNIAKLNSWRIKQGLGDDTSWESVEDSRDLFVQSELDLTTQFTEEWYSNKDIQETTSLPAYVSVRVNEALSTKTSDLLNLWWDELKGYEAKGINLNTQYQKWSGYPMNTTDELAGNATIEEFNKEFGKVSNKNLIVPTSTDEIPNDLELDLDSNEYYSRSTDNYYKRETVNKILDL